MESFFCSLNLYVQQKNSFVLPTMIKYVTANISTFSVLLAPPKLHILYFDVILAYRLYWSYNITIGLFFIESRGAVFSGFQIDFFPISWLFHISYAFSITKNSIFCSYFSLPTMLAAAKKSLSSITLYWAINCKGSIHSSPRA